MNRSLLHRLYQSRALSWGRPVWRLARALGRRIGYSVRDPFDRGLSRSFGGHPVTVPVEFAGYWRAHYTNYEFPAARALGAWFARHPNGLLLDIGCELGQYSLLALGRSPASEVIAFDADLASLKATARMCRLVSPPGRLKVVYGLLCAGGDSAPLDRARADTGAALARCGAPGLPGTTQFVCLDNGGGADVPRHNLSGLLLPGATDPARPVLLKCDVEGAEFEVLKGAGAYIARHKPALLLSVHPNLLPKFGSSCDELAAWLSDLGYQRTLIGSDHEEHWWCEPSAVPS
jgi:FkbM family methyltransferase